MKAIADTGFFVAFANRGDRHHQWAFELARRITEPVLTCEAVLAETAFHLGDAQLVLEMVETGLTRLAFNAEDHLEQLRKSARKYADRQPDLADLCLIRMSELFPDRPVITVDEADFKVYRRNRREVIPHICPPRE